MMNTLTKEQAAIANNEAIFAELMEDWDCTYLEAVAASEFNCASLEDTQDAIAKAVTHAKLLKELLPAALDYYKNDYYKGATVTESFLQSEAKELVKIQAYTFVYEWDQYDNYDTISEADKEAVLFGNEK